MPRDSRFLASLRPQHDAHFERKEKELIEKLQKREAQTRGQTGPSGAPGVSDEEILEVLEELGYSRDYLQALHVLPLVLVAWADGEMEAKEAAKIRQIAAGWGIAPGSRAAKKIESWIAIRPDKAWVRQSLRIMRAIERFRPESRQQTEKRDILAHCAEVAKAAGGFLGMGAKISPKEQEVIDRLSRELFGRHPAASEDIANQLK